MVFFRWIIGVPIAALITAGLFMIMAGLIQKPIIEVDPAKPNPDLDIFMKPIPPEGPRTKPIKEEVPKAPQTEIEFKKPSKNPGGTQTGPAPTPATTKGPVIPTQFPTPIIRMEPPYPEGCRAKGIEGNVLVQFDVTAEGNVVNVRVIEAPDRCFNRIVSTVSKWKYPPAYQDGRPVKRYGVVERFTFQLTG